jgi:RNA polymerase sigma factor (sigma-70 family)
MVARPLDLVLRRLATESRSDRELLEQFLTGKNEQAFAALVQRHQGMVHSVCRSVLRHCQDAEDACQAAFLVLAKQARSIRDANALAGWLHGVAFRIASQAKKQAARRRLCERRAASTEVSTEDDMSWREVQCILHAELERLPEKYRLPLIACCLEGHTRDEAARQLGWTFGTLKGMLDRGRELLRKRLERRGVTMAAALATITLTQDAMTATSLATARAALAFAAGRAADLASTTAMSLAEVALNGSPAPPVKLLTFLVAGLVVIGAAGYQASQKSDPPPKGQRPQPANADKSKPNADRFDDPLPDGAIARLGTNRFRHTLSIGSIAYSSDGKLIASGSEDASVRIWDAGTGRQMMQFGDQHSFVEAVALTADGKRVAAGTSAGELALWDIATGKAVQRFKGPGFKAHEFLLRSVAFLPGDKFLVSGGDGEVRLWDVATGKLEWTIRGDKGSRFRVAAAPDGKRIASADGIGTVCLRDAATGQSVWAFQSGRRSSIAFSPDGGTIAAGGKGADVVLLEAKTGKMSRLLEDEGLDVNDLAFSRDGKLLAAAISRSPIVVWNTETGKVAARLGSDSMSASTVAFAPDGKTIAAGDNQTIRQWDVASGKEIRPLGAPEAAIRAVAFAPGGKTLATAGQDSMVRLWDVASWKERRKWRDSPVMSVAFSPNGKSLAATGAEPVYLWDTTSGKLLHQIDTKSIWADNATFTPDGKLLAFIRLEGRIELWDTENGQFVHFWKLDDNIHSFAFSPDGRLLAASAGFDIHLWSMATRQKIRSWTVRDSPFILGSHAIAFSRDGRLLVSAGGSDAVVRLWDYTAGRQVGRMQVAEQGGIDAIALSPDGTTLACHSYLGNHILGNHISLWDVARCKEIHRLIGHESTMLSLAYSPDGKMLASGGWDTTVVIWDVSGKKASAPPQRALSAEELDKHWANLVSDDDSLVSYSLCEFVAAGKQSAAYLKGRLSPSSSATAEQEKVLAQSIADLDSEAFRTREKAMRELENLGDVALPALLKAQTEPTSLEARRRIERLLSRIDKASRQELRAVEVLERIGTPEAKQLLQKLAAGAPGARLTCEAKAALERLNRRIPWK